MARNRKRRSDQRSPRPADGTTSQRGVATARADRSGENPDPIEHGTPDVELAEAQMAMGRSEAGEVDPEGDYAEAESEPTASSAAAPVPAKRGGSRLVQFLEGSWRELQRVQWPDRPQVMQATGVVIGFCIIAGLFLGVADFVAGKLVNFILK